MSEVDETAHLSESQLGLAFAYCCGMPRPPRMLEDDMFYHITSRTFQGRYLLLPTAAVLRIVGWCLAKSLRRYRIELFAYAVMSNHFHLLIRGAAPDIPLLMRDFKRSVSLHVGQKLGRWIGNFWARRYDAVPVLDETALEDTFRYILGHGTKEGLVKSPLDWPGLHFSRQVLRPDRDRCFTHNGSREELSLSRLPELEDLDSKRYRKRVGKLLKQIEAQARVSVELLPNLLAREPQFKPKRLKSSPIPRYRASSKFIATHFLSRYRQFINDFRYASGRYCAGQLSVAFPDNSYRPPLGPLLKTGNRTPLQMLAP